MSQIARTFAFYIRRFNIDLREGWSMRRADSFMTVYPGMVLLSISGRLEGSEAMEAAGLQIARLALGHGCTRSGLTGERLNRKEWKAAMRWLALLLIPEHVVKEAQRLGWEAWQIAEAAGVSERLVYFRDRDMEVQALYMGKLVPFPSRRAKGSLEHNEGW
jgi:hypothetical protein